MRIPPGTGLLLIGSGLYWILSGPLIGWFSVLNPFQIHLSQLGVTIIQVVGIACLVIGLWVVHLDLEKLRRLFSRSDGWVFTVPIILVVADVYLTLVGVARGNWELNPFVASAVQGGSWAIVPFVVSYLALSEGLALGLLGVGNRLFGNVSSSKYLPFALVCGAASFGPVNNTELLAFPGAGAALYFIGMILSMISLSAGLLFHFGTLRARGSNLLLQ